jgi:hypothetical protein
MGAGHTLILFEQSSEHKQYRMRLSNYRRNKLNQGLLYRNATGGSASPDRTPVVAEHEL